MTDINTQLLIACGEAEFALSLYQACGDDVGFGMVLKTLREALAAAGYPRQGANHTDHQ